MPCAVMSWHRPNSWDAMDAEPRPPACRQPPPGTASHCLMLLPEGLAVRSQPFGLLSQLTPGSVGAACNRTPEKIHSQRADSFLLRCPCSGGKPVLHELRG